MRDHPTATDLLAIARDVVLKQLAPALPENLRLDALMVANALAIAQREQAGDDSRLARLRDGFAALYGADLPLEAMARQAAADLRLGALGAERRARLHAVLLGDARERVQASNPRYLREP